MIVTVRNIDPCYFLRVYADLTGSKDGQQSVGGLHSNWPEKGEALRNRGLLFPVFLCLWFWASSAFPPSCLPSSTRSSCERHNTTAHPGPTPWPPSSSTHRQLAIHPEILSGMRELAWVTGVISEQVIGSSQVRCVPIPGPISCGLPHLHHHHHPSLEVTLSHITLYSFQRAVGGKGAKLPGWILSHRERNYL